MTTIQAPNVLKLNDLILSVDIETSGLNPKETDILEFAALISPLHPYKYPIDRFHCFFKHENGVRWNTSTREFHQKNGYFEYQSTKQIPWYTPQEFIGAFSHWVLRHQVWRPKSIDKGGILIDRGLSMTAVGKNFASFDLQFLINLPDVDFNSYKFFKHRAIDIGNLMWNPLLDGNTLPASEVCLERGGAGMSGSSYKHRAMDDAEMMLTLLKHVLKKYLS